MSSYSIGQMNQLCDGLEETGFTANDLTKIGQNPKLRRHILGITRGELTVQEPEIPTWTTVELGGYTDTGKLLADIERRGIRVLDWARDIAGKITLSAEHERDLVAPTVHELGFDQSTRYDKICKRARERGFSLVPQDAALFAALQVPDKVERGYYLFAMEPATDSGGDPYVFGLVRLLDGGLVLHAYFGYPGRVLDPDDRVVFSRT